MKKYTKNILKPNYTSFFYLPIPFVKYIVKDEIKIKGVKGIEKIKVHKQKNGKSDKYIINLPYHLDFKKGDKIEIEMKKDTLHIKKL